MIAQKNSIKKIKPKQIKVSLYISDHDLSHKKRQIDKFISKNKPVKIALQMRGRQAYTLENELIENKLLEMFNEFDIINSWSSNNNYYLFFNSYKNV